MYRQHLLREFLCLEKATESTLVPTGFLNGHILFWACLYLFNASLIRAGLPTLGITARQAHLLDVIDNSDVLFLSGGGYLTGMTLTRLWDNMLLISLASAFGVPTILSGLDHWPL